MIPVRLIFGVLLIAVLGCGSGKTTQTQPVTIAGTWNVVMYEIKSPNSQIMSPKEGDWVYEFNDQDQLHTLQSGREHQCTYVIKNKTELWIDDMGSYHPYRIITLAAHHLVLENEHEKLTLTR
jgi:hypothetical protein